MVRTVLVVIVLLALDLGMFSAQNESASSTDEAIAAMVDRLRVTPFLYNTSTDHLSEIFERGQQLGNRAHVFTKVGDSNTTNGDFLRPLGMDGPYCELGPYSNLQATIDFFSVSPRDGVLNSFDSPSLAAFPGLSSSAALDPFWVSAPCESNESPLACEYRLVKPSIAILMIGLMDVRYETDIETYRANMEQIVQSTVDLGIIPVLTTIVVLPDQERLSYELSIQINAVMLDIADSYGIPLINLWAAVQDLPDFGIGPDRTHLKAQIGKYCSFNGPELELGGTLRNLLTLQMLDALRTNVLQQTSWISPMTVANTRDPLQDCGKSKTCPT